MSRPKSDRLRDWQITKSPRPNFSFHKQSKLKNIFKEKKEMLKRYNFTYSKVNVVSLYVHIFYNQ